MPQRPFSRDQIFLLPPSLDDWVAPDHPVRFVAALLDELDDAQWAELGVPLRAEALGSPRYAPTLLTALWVYGFMSGVRSSRGLETACRDQLPFRWLSANQTPDHNTLWRFYQAHRQGLRGLPPHTVRVAVRAGLIDWSLQAVDGTKLAANAARDRSLAETDLSALLGRVETALDDLEARETRTEEADPPRLPPGMRQATQLRARVRAALAVVTAADGPRRANVTDPEANLMQTRQGIVPAYNAQAAVVPVAIAPGEPSGRLITAVRVTRHADDHGALAAVIEAAAQLTGRPSALTTADGGFHDGPSLRACAELGAAVALPEGPTRRRDDPFPKQAFADDGAADVFICPQGQALTRRGITRARRGEPQRR
jgi:transposase